MKRFRVLEIEEKAYAYEVEAVNKEAAIKQVRLIETGPDDRRAPEYDDTLDSWYLAEEI